MSAAGTKKASGKFSDPYDRPARLYPSLMVLSPLAILIICLYGKEEPLMWSSITIAASCGGAYTLSRVARNAGQRLQSKVFQSWSGAPTTQLLRHGNRHFDIHTKERFHKALSKGIGKKMPTPTAEATDPSSADELYRAATAWLIGQTRDTKKFPLVFKENISFGFHRNALGLRSLGIAVAAASAIWCALHIWIQSTGTMQGIVGAVTPRVLISMIYSCMILAMWILVFNEAALKRAGFSYAERLMQSLDLMKPTAARISSQVSQGGK